MSAPLDKAITEWRRQISLKADDDVDILRGGRGWGFLFVSKRDDDQWFDEKIDMIVAERNPNPKSTFWEPNEMRRKNKTNRKRKRKMKRK